MEKIKLATTYSPVQDQVEEAVHWAIQRGEIVLPGEEQELIDAHKTNLNILLSFFIRLYINKIMRNEFEVARELIEWVPRLRDPYLPDICRDLGICDDEDDELFLDSTAESGRWGV